MPQIELPDPDDLPDLTDVALHHMVRQVSLQGPTLGEREATL